MPLPVLFSWLDVYPESGTLFWRYRDDRHPHWNARFSGKRAGGVNTQGYRVVRVLGGLYREHHIVWAVVHGCWAREIDHIDGDRLNNKISNLREVTRSENLRNRGLDRRNTSGVIGVSFHKATGRWRARLGLKPNPIELGIFDSLADAAEARRLAEIRYGFHPMHGRRPAHGG
jgi:hypothetical protein